MEDLLSTFVVLWAVIDPVGTVPVFISATAGVTRSERWKIAATAALTAAGLLLFFIVVGEPLLVAMGVELPAFQIAGGIVLFLFALTMIFGESKPEGEAHMLGNSKDVAVFPLATPSLASPGAMMAVVLLTENETHAILDQVVTASIMLLVVAIAFGLMIASNVIIKTIGSGGVSVVSRVMGLILASIAATNVLEGLKEFFTAAGQ